MNRRKVLGLLACLPFSGLIGFTSSKKDGYVIYVDNMDGYSGCYTEPSNDKDYTVIFNNKEQANEELDSLVASYCEHGKDGICESSVFEHENGYYGIGKKNGNGYILTKTIEVIKV